MPGAWRCWERFRRACRPLGLPDVSRHDLNALLPIALAGFVLAAVETSAIGRMFGQKHGHRLDANQELLALGAANLLAGLGRGFPVSGGMSQSLVNESAGARTPLSGLVAALFTLGRGALRVGTAAESAATGAGRHRAGRRHGPGRRSRAAAHLAIQPRRVRGGHRGAARRARLGAGQRRVARRRDLDRAADAPDGAPARRRARPAFRGRRHFGDRDAQPGERAHPWRAGGPLRVGAALLQRGLRRRASVRSLERASGSRCG